MGGATVFDNGMDLITSDQVDAVLMASIGETHAAFMLACIAAGKPVLCEKPLAPTMPECVQILEAEVAFGKRLVMVGFMRRFDPGYREVKAARLDGRLGVAADAPQHPPQPGGAGLVHELHDDHRRDHPRVRHDPLDARRGDRHHPGHPAGALAEGRRRTSRTRSSRR